MSAAAPAISVVIATRDRPDRVPHAVRAVLGGDDLRFDVTVVDQSDGDVTVRALEPLLADERVHYVRSAPAGLAAGRNVGIRAVSGELVALTDDDCEAEAGWLAGIAAAFARDERIGVVFGDVRPATERRRAGFVPGCVAERPVLARALRDKDRVEGMGACMAVRRSAWEALGGFDEMLGAGAPLRAGDDGDLAIRALAAGWFVYATPAVAVTHHGFRAPGEGRALVCDYWFGTGAVFAKHLRRRRLGLIPVLARLAGRWAWSRSPVAASLDRPYRGARLVAFGRGLRAGAVTPLDRQGGHFRRPSSR